MSEIANCKGVTLGQREAQFLQMVSVGERSAYSIYSELNDGETNNGKARKLPRIRTSHTDSMSYKNVHKRIKRLETLGLIQQVEKQKQKGKEIKFRLTSRGLFQRVLSYRWPEYFVVLPIIYKDDIILQTILYQYFELETVKKIMEIFGDSVFDSFVMKCCEQIQEFVDGISAEFDLEYGTRRIKEWSNYYFEKYLRIFNQDSWSGKEIGKQIDGMIKNEIKNLIHEILRESTNISRPMLVRDEKFIELLEDIKNEFREGCKNFIY